MIKKILFFVLILILFGVFLTLAMAKNDTYDKYRHADKNKDGVVDKKEYKMNKDWQKKNKDKNKDGIIDAKEKRLSSWMHNRARVNTKAEALYDKNNDGYIEASEVRQMLQNKYALVKSKGSAKVDSAVERVYDINNDGIIDAVEAEVLLEDILQ
ncbi:MAG: hypothetical protein ABIG46_00180 [Candidatus Omnitrophota bacterium]